MNSKTNTFVYMKVDNVSTETCMFVLQTGQGTKLSPQN